MIKKSRDQLVMEGKEKPVVQNPLSYLAQAVANRFRQILRKKSSKGWIQEGDTEKGIRLDQILEREDSTPPKLEREEEVEKLDRIVNNLPANHQKMWQAYKKAVMESYENADGDGGIYTKVGRDLGISQKAAKSGGYRTLVRIQEEYDSPPYLRSEVRAGETGMKEAKAKLDHLSRNSLVFLHSSRFPFRRTETHRSRQRRLEQAFGHFSNRNPYVLSNMVMHWDRYAGLIPEKWRGEVKQVLRRMIEPYPIGKLVLEVQRESASYHRDQALLIENIYKVGLELAYPGIFDTEKHGEFISVRIPEGMRTYGQKIDPRVSLAENVLMEEAFRGYAASVTRAVTMLSLILMRPLDYALGFSRGDVDQRLEQQLLSLTAYLLDRSFQSTEMEIVNPRIHTAVVPILLDAYTNSKYGRELKNRIRKFFLLLSPNEAAAIAPLTAKLTRTSQNKDLLHHMLSRMGYFGKVELARLHAPAKTVQPPLIGGRHSRQQIKNLQDFIEALDKAGIIRGSGTRDFMAELIREEPVRFIREFKVISSLVIRGYLKRHGGQPAIGTVEIFLRALHPYFKSHYHRSEIRSETNVSDTAKHSETRRFGEPQGSRTLAVLESLDSSRSEVRGARKRDLPSADRVAQSYRERGYFGTLEHFHLPSQTYYRLMNGYVPQRTEDKRDYFALNYEEAKSLVENLEDRKPYGVLNSETTARSLILATLDTVQGFKAAREGNDIKRMADLYRKVVIAYQPKDKENYSNGGQLSFFYERGGLSGLMTRSRSFLAKKASPAPLLRLVLPELIDAANPDALDPVEVEDDYWTDEVNARYHILRTLDKVEGFKGARERKDIKLMAELYRKAVIGYEPKNKEKYSKGGQKSFFYEAGGLSGLMTHPRPFLAKETSPASLLRLVLPKLIDAANPDALDPVEVEHDYWTDEGNARYHILRALDRVEGFKEARQKKDIKRMAEFYRKAVIGYESKDKEKYSHGGQATFFKETGGLSGLMNKSRPFLAKMSSAGSLLRLVLPELIDDQNPDALKPEEVERESRSEVRSLEDQASTLDSRRETRFDKSGMATRTASSRLTSWPSTFPNLSSTLLTRVDNSPTFSAMTLTSLRKDSINVPTSLPEKDFSSFRILTSPTDIDGFNVGARNLFQNDPFVNINNMDNNYANRLNLSFNRTLIFKEAVSVNVALNPDVIWAAVVVDEVLSGRKVSPSEVKTAVEVIAAVDTDEFIELLKAVSAHATQPEMIQREQKRLIAAFKQRFPKQSLSLGIIFPQAMSAPELENVGASLNRLQAGTLVVPRRLKFLNELRKIGMHLQQVDFGRPAFVGQDSLSVAVLEDQAEGKLDEMFVPFTAQGAQKIEDYFVRSQIQFIQLLSAGIAATLLKENPELKDNPRALRAELLKILGPQYEKAINPQGQGFDVSPIAIRVQIELLARAEILKAA